RQEQIALLAAQPAVEVQREPVVGCEDRLRFLGDGHGGQGEGQGQRGKDGQHWATPDREGMGSLTPRRVCHESPNLSTALASAGRKPPSPRASGRRGGHGEHSPRSALTRASAEAGGLAAQALARRAWGRHTPAPGVRRACKGTAYPPHGSDLFPRY